jgi:3-dehydroquinate synthase
MFGRLAGFPQAIEDRLGRAQRVIFTDAHLAEAYAEQLQAFCPDVLEVVPAGEATKCFESVIAACSRLAAGAIERSAVVIVFGGGVVGDFGGFVASIYMRGLPLVQIPTSLVAMVDSSLGGKVGINLPTAKNLVGSFYPARVILCDPSLLRSLPYSEFANGMAEAVKHALLDSQEHWDWLKALEPRPTEWPEASLEQLVARSSQVKQNIIEQDPYERSIRAHLNFGHTLGHAVEAVSGGMSGTGLSHGQAVSIGLVASLKLSQKLGRLRHSGLTEEVAGVLRGWSLPTSISPELTWPAVERAMRNDKKVKAGRLRFVLLSQPGEAEIVDNVPGELVEQAFEEMRCEL